MRLLDTNIVSFILKNDTRFALYQPHIAGRDLAISFMTQGELYAGAALANWGKNRWSRLDLLLSTMLIIPSDEDTARRYASIRVQRRRQPISTADGWIAATALCRGLELVTHNPSDFKGIAGLKIITEMR